MAPFNTTTDATSYYESTNLSNENNDVSGPGKDLCASSSRCEDPSLYYDMSRDKILIIFNHYRYKKTRHFKYVPCTRAGTYQDVRSLEKSFRSRGFMVITHDDWTYRDIMEYLREVMTHGKGVHVCASDRMYPVEDITRMLRTAPTLFGKPKLFFIQACRGRHTKSRAQPDDVSVPMDADCLLLYSTCPDYLSYRNKATGSWLMQALCKVMDSRPLTTDLVRMVPVISGAVAAQCTLQGYKQSPATEMCFTKYLML